MHKAYLTGPHVRRYNAPADWYRMIYARFLENQPYRHLFEPRKINPPGGYQAVKSAAAGLFSLLMETSAKSETGFPVLPLEISANCIAYQVAAHNAQIYYVNEDFLRAVAATDLPSDFTIDDLKWPLPGLIFGLPTRFTREYVGVEISYVFTADMPIGEYRLPDAYHAVEHIGPRPPIVTPYDKVGWYYFHLNEQRAELGVTAYDKHNPLDKVIASYGYTDYTDGSEAKVKADAELGNKMSSLMLKLFAVLNLEPSLVERGTIVRPAKGLGGKAHPTGEGGELWSANVIGARYVVTRQTAPDGTHASPRWHWRRGHITHQRIGSPKSPSFVPVSSLPRDAEGHIDWKNVDPATVTAFWACHRRAWLKPVLVNFDEPESPKPAESE